MMRSKEFKTSRSILMLILRFSLSERFLLLILDSLSERSLTMYLYTHTITHSHTHSQCLSLVLVVMIKSKDLKTKISHTHSLILSLSLWASEPLWSESLFPSLAFSLEFISSFYLGLGRRWSSCAIWPAEVCFISNSWHNLLLQQSYAVFKMQPNAASPNLNFATHATYATYATLQLKQHSHANNANNIVVQDANGIGHLICSRQLEHMWSICILPWGWGRLTRPSSKGHLEHCLQLSLWSLFDSTVLSECISFARILRMWRGFTRLVRNY